MEWDIFPTKDATSIERVIRNGSFILIYESGLYALISRIASVQDEKVASREKKEGYCKLRYGILSEHPEEERWKTEVKLDNFKRTRAR